MALQTSLPSGGGEVFKRVMSTRRSIYKEPAVVREMVKVTSVRSGRMFISSLFGWRSDPLRGTYRHHAGIDLPGSQGTHIQATGDGRVAIAGWVSGYGNLVEIEHAGSVRTRYGHLSRLFVVRGAHVTRGQIIAAMGSTGRSTGTHLHYEVRLNGVAVDPLRFIGQTQSIYAYETGWTPERQVASRWTGWGDVKSLGQLPAATIR